MTEVNEFASRLSAKFELETPLTLEEKVDYLFTQAKAVESLLEQVEPLLAQAGPMLDSLAPLLGGLGSKASSPMGRIFGSLL